MNRLIIIGNGFDLAHKLPTSYCEFLDFIWQNIGQVKSNDKFSKLFHIDFNHFRMELNFINYEDFCNKVEFNFKGYSNYEFRYLGEDSFELYHTDRDFGRNSNYKIFGFKNKLLELITISGISNWVDIENEYYKVLISLVKNENIYKQIEDIEQLNNEFRDIRDLLKYYLIEKVENSFNFSNGTNDIVNIFEYQIKLLNRDSKNKYFLEFPNSQRRSLIDFDLLFKKNITDDVNDINLFENLFLDFNYTSTVRSYVETLNKKESMAFGKSYHIQIHGSLNESDNAINFGFGDEMDDYYKVIENTGDNRYLENIKSFMYQNNSNYRNLLNWIDTKEFQVYIMGHSCGLSDRTLLNTIFEHSNCKSIKIFYHQRENGNDNFREISMNISRHFNKKALMREKLVDKSLSNPLPQDIRFQVKNKVNL